MRPINVTLDSLTWEYAKQKTNFSEWVRKQLRLEAEGHTFEAMDKEMDLIYEQKEKWYQKYAALRKEMELKE
tara:strand:- start:344 stop:559 length:216 start_codon:yes stop_codon:yes gene_type:complete